MVEKFKMESPDPLMNKSNVAGSRRSVSILKAPRTSVDFADPELVESQVEVAMPVEKRNSRRVSFAPATDVLLFSKNGSPVRKPLQDLSAAINPDNRNPIGVIVKGKQPIADMENLLYAPLQTSQQRKEVSMVSHDAEDLYGEKTMMFSADDADIDVTHSQTVMITNDSDLPYQDGEMLPTCANIDFFMSMDRKKAEPCTLPTISSSSVRHYDLEFEKLLANFSEPSLPKDNSMLHKVEQNVSIQSKDVHCPDDSSQNDSKVTGPPEGLSPNHSGSRENLGDHLKNRSHGLTAGTIPNYTSTFSISMFSLDGKVTRVSDLNDQLDASQNDVKSTPLSVNKNSPGNANAFGASPESATMQKNDGSDLSQENCSLSCGLESAPCITAAVDGVDDTSSTKSRQMSLADLRFKIRRMSRLLDEPTERIAVDVCDAPLSQPKSASDGISDKTPLTALQHNPETQTTDNADYTQPEQSAEEQQPCVTAPLKLNRRSLSSRLSMGNLLPKRPRRSCRSPGREHDYEVATHQLSSGMSDNIVDEVLPNFSSEEDTSMVNENPQSTNEDGSSLHGRHLQGTSEEVVWVLSPGHPSDSQCERTSPVDGEDMMAAEKRRRISSESNIETPNQSPEKGKCIGTFPLTPAVMAKAKDVSKRSTSQLRSETTFESTLKQSLFESQLEGHMDYTNDFQKNVADESITVSEFFQLLNIDFVIHNPRQSILPGKLASHLGHTPDNLLKNRHIHHPKQMVYEAEHKNLAEKVERLKARMKDQARLLHTVNQPLWEELKCFSEDELKIFGSKMKERSNFFRKRSKAQSHEMKEALYSNLLQANLEERQRLQGKTEEADGMLKSLDDCIQELETELAAVEENGSGDSKLTLKSGQLGLEKVTIEIADKERQMCEMEVQKKCNVDQVKRLQVEIQDLNGHFTLLQGLNEWKLAERRADCDVYSFLYGSLLLEVVFDTGAGPDERNILDINFKLELDEEKSECHARLVHTLVSDFINGQSHWVGKYLSSRCVPKLLHDVALVVSRLRLLGEEVRRLRTWGCVKFNISDIRCVGKRVHIVFSSLEAMVEFELSLAVTMAYPCSPLQLQDFKNHIGSTSVCRLEEIVSSVSPDKNYLTRIVMAIHAAVHS